MAWIQNATEAAASHNCWAFRIGDDYRSHDAGEPAGTAGRPILAAIDGQKLDRVAVVISRYFGGIKLGAGGLVRAYGGTAAECLRLASKIEQVALVTLQLEIGFDWLGAAHSAIQTFGAQKLDEQFHAQGVFILLSLRSEQAATFHQHLSDQTRGTAKITEAAAPGFH